MSSSSLPTSVGHWRASGTCKCGSACAFASCHLRVGDGYESCASWPKGPSASMNGRSLPELAGLAAAAVQGLVALGRHAGTPSSSLTRASRSIRGLSAPVTPIGIGWTCVRSWSSRPDNAIGSSAAADRSRERGWLRCAGVSEGRLLSLMRRRCVRSGVRTSSTRPRRLDSAAAGARIGLFGEGTPVGQIRADRLRPCAGRPGSENGLVLPPEGHSNASFVPAAVAVSLLFAWSLNYWHLLGWRL